MNEERAALINAVVEKRWPAAQAARLLDALLELEEGRRYAIEPPCRVPPWREDDDRLYELHRSRSAAALLLLSHSRIAWALEAGDMEQVAFHYAALDAMYLAGFWADGRPARFAFAGLVLIERDGALHRDWFNIVAADDAALAVFSHPLPIVEGAAPRDWAAAGDGRFRLTTAAKDRGTVATPLGAFGDCLRVTRQTRRSKPGTARPDDGRCEDGELEETVTVWMAAGVGPVRIRRERAVGRMEIDLVACSGMEGDGWFPRRPGCFWRFADAGGSEDYRELWRVLAHPDPGSIWLVTSAYRRKE